MGRAVLPPEANGQSYSESSLNVTKTSIRVMHMIYVYARTVACYVYV